MSNLTEKFAALESAQAARHTAMLAKLDALAGTANLATIYNEIVALRGTGGPETTLRSINQSIWNLAGTAPGASLLEILTALQARATETTSAAILAAIGTLASNPANYTVKDLLALINASINENPPGKAGSDMTGGGGTGSGGTGGTGGTGTADGPTNADPGSCSGTWLFDSSRTFMQYVGTIWQVDVTYDIYAPTIMDYSPYFVQYGSTIKAGSNTTGPSDAVTVCVSWDFTGMAAAPSVMSITDPYSDGSWLSAVDIASTGTYVGCDTVTFDVFQTYTWRVAVPSGIKPPNNMWFHVTANASLPQS
jgi:hypothetical protein